MDATKKSFIDKAKAFVVEAITGIPVETNRHSSPTASFPFPTGNLTGRVIYAGSFDGEKNLGEMGPVKFYLMDYYALSLRSWQAYTESAEAQTILRKFCTWVIGKGLKLQCEPVKSVVGKSNTKLKNFSDDVESRYHVFANSKMADYSSQQTLHQLSNTAYKNAIVGGDVLVILRYIDDCVKVQLIDGSHIMSPTYGSEWFPQIMASGNRCINGVEINDRGEHIAYYVRKPYDNQNPFNSLLLFDRIPAKGAQSGLTMAFLVYGSKHRVDNHRGIPLLTSVLEKLKTIERYETATLSAAEEQNKLTYQVVHEQFSDGESPFTSSIAKARDVDGFSDLPRTNDGQELANKVKASTDRETVNNPIGAEIKPLKSNESQLYFKDFLEKNIDIVCACVEIPPNVAMSKYDSNYSASRAAVKDWEHTLSVKRKDFSIEFLQPVYNFWLETEILKNEIQAPGYLIAKAKNDLMTLEAYRTCRFVGAPVANIDPMKEVQAERLKLGITAESIPLTTVEAATEILNGGDSDHNMEQFSEELQSSKDFGLRPEPEVKQTSVVSDK